MKLVLVKTYEKIEEAEIEKKLLENSGIQSMIQDNGATKVPSETPIMTKLFVTEENLKQSIDLLM